VKEGTETFLGRTAAIGKRRTSKKRGGVGLGGKRKSQERGKKCTLVARIAKGRGPGMKTPGGQA